MVFTDLPTGKTVKHVICDCFFPSSVFVLFSSAILIGSCLYVAIRMTPRWIFTWRYFHTSLYYFVSRCNDRAWNKIIISIFFFFAYDNIWSIKIIKLNKEKSNAVFFFFWNRNNELLFSHGMNLKKISTFFFFFNRNLCYFFQSSLWHPTTYYV